MLVEILGNVPVLLPGVADDGQLLEFFCKLLLSPMLYDTESPPFARAYSIA